MAKKEIAFFVETNENGGGKFYDYEEDLHHTEYLDKNKKYEIGLVSANIWLSYYNISLELGNNGFPYTSSVAPAGTFNIVFPDGHYSLSELQIIVASQLASNGHLTNSIQFVPIYAQGKIQLQLTTGFSVDFSAYTIRNILGFDAGVYSSTTTAQNRAMFLPHNNVLIHCSMADNHYVGKKSGVNSVYVGQISGIPSVQQTLQPPHVIYHPLKNHLDEIRTFRVWITDENLNFIKLNQKMTMVLHVRQQKDQ
jgi:hypothetical protein